VLEDVAVVHVATAVSGEADGDLEPLGTGRHLTSDTVARIARRQGRTPAQVLLRWCIERGIPIIPKSTHRERIAENAQLFDFRLSNQDVAELDALDRTGGTDRALERKWWRS
jgi:diketogulonate reductase-like aldo/keto reductase